MECEAMSAANNSLAKVFGWGFSELRYFYPNVLPFKSNKFFANLNP
jgi:hypothetical protein